MTPEEREKIKNEIVKTIESTTEEIERLKELSKPVPPDNAIGRITRMDAIQSKSISEANLHSAENKLTALNIALGNSDKPDFGMCRICGNQIQTGRLLFLPESSVCVKCADR